jgi:hypothetical protein
LTKRASENTARRLGASPLPKFVRAELEGYVHCGVLARGFALLECPSCSEPKLVAFSCVRAIRARMLRPDTCGSSPTSVASIVVSSSRHSAFAVRR